MKKNIFIILLFFISLIRVWSQKTIKECIEKYNSNSIVYIHMKDLHNIENKILLDTRKKQEYNTSHLKNAIWVGYESFDTKHITSRFPDKNTSLIVYCSIGVRSEDIGEKLKKIGYTNVKNLYGGIFNWKNKKGTIYNIEEKETDSIHAFNKLWGKLITNGIKVYDLKQDKE